MKKIKCNKCKNTNDIVKVALINANNNKIYKVSNHSYHCFKCDNNGVYKKPNTSNLIY